MKPKFAICTQVYSNIYPSRENEHYVCFEVDFDDNQMKQLLTVKTNKNHRKPFEFKLNEFGSFTDQFEPWQNDSWQNALFMAWQRYTSVSGYCAAITDELIYELQEQEDGQFCYELTDNSKRQIATLYPRFTTINSEGIEEHGMFVPENKPTWFNTPSGATEIPGGSKNDEILIETISEHGSEAPFMTPFNMQVLSGFMMALGTAAIAIAFSLLNAATLGAAGVVVASVGLVSLVAGCGFFKVASDYSSSEDPSLPEALASPSM